MLCNKRNILCLSTQKRLNRTPKLVDKAKEKLLNYWRSVASQYKDKENKRKGRAYGFREVSLTIKRKLGEAIT